MFERFTNGSRRVLVLAQEESRRFGHPYIGPEHIFLGLIGEGRGGAAQALASAGITLEAARVAVVGLVAARGARQDAPPFTPEAKQVLERSLREVLARVDHEITTEHLLFALVTPPEQIVDSALDALGTSADDIRQRAENVLGGREPGGDGPVERFFEHLSARDWSALSELLAPDVVRVGPLGDEVRGRTDYLALLAGSVPTRYGNDVHRLVYATDKRSAFARVTEHLTYADEELRLEEAYVFVLDEVRLLIRVEVFWQSPPQQA